MHGSRSSRASRAVRRPATSSKASCRGRTGSGAPRLRGRRRSHRQHLDRPGFAFTAVNDRYRVPTLALLLGLFAVAVTVVGGWRGVRSLIALTLTLAVIVKHGRAADPGRLGPRLGRDRGGVGRDRGHVPDHRGGAPPDGGRGRGDVHLADPRRRAGPGLRFALALHAAARLGVGWVPVVARRHERRPGRARPGRGHLRGARRPRRRHGDPGGHGAGAVRGGSAVEPAWRSLVAP